MCNRPPLLAASGRISVSAMMLMLALTLLRIAKIRVDFSCWFRWDLLRLRLLLSFGICSDDISLLEVLPKTPRSAVISARSSDPMSQSVVE